MEWCWQYVFSTGGPSVDPVKGMKHSVESPLDLLADRLAQ